MKKKTFKVIRKDLLNNLARGQKNLNELSKISHVSWRTTRNHMIYLVGMGFAKRVVDLPQVKIYEVTQGGLSALAHKSL